MSALVTTSIKSLLPCDGSKPVVQFPRAFDGAVFRLRERLLVVRTFAKGHGPAGIRVGSVIGPRNLIDYMKRVRPHFQSHDARSSCERFLAAPAEVLS